MGGKSPQAWGCSSAHHLVPVDLVACGSQLLAQHHTPSTTIVHLGPYHPRKVAGDLYLALSQRADVFATETGDEVAQFQQYVLAGTWLQFSRATGAPLVIGCEQHNGKANVAMGLHLLNDGATTAGLLVKNDRH